MVQSDHPVKQFERMSLELKFASILQYQGTKRATNPDDHAPIDHSNPTLSPDGANQLSSKYPKRTLYSVPRSSSPVKYLQIVQSAILGRKDIYKDQKYGHKALLYRKSYEILGTLNRLTTTAWPDTCAGVNTISKAFAIVRGYHVENECHDRTIIKTPNGGETVSEGIVKLKWGFGADPREIHDLIFHVVDHSPHEVILGCPLLQETETMTTNRSRIVVRKIYTSQASCFRKACYQGVSRSMLPHIKGNIDGTSTSALADSGCEVNIMSLAYARAHGLNIDNDPDSRETLLFADGQKRQTFGRVLAPWMFADTDEEQWVPFEVLEDSMFDVVLGQDFIFDTNVFGSHASSIVYLSDTFQQGHDGFSCHYVNSVRLIPKLFRKSKKEEAHVAQGDLNWVTESERRIKAQDEINIMSDGADKHALRTAEEQRSLEWIIKRKQQQQQALAAPSPGSSSHVAASTDSTRSVSWSQVSTSNIT